MAFKQVAVLVSAMTVATASNVTPLQKVIQMLGELMAKGKQEKHDETVAFSEFQAWCDGTRTETKSSIGRSADHIEQLEADINKAGADAEQLAGEVAALQAQIAQDELEAAQATNIRKEQAAQYDALHADLSESIDAIERAIGVLKAKEADVPQSLLQLQKSPLIPARAKAVIASFLQAGSNFRGEAGAPEANAYEFQSGGVVAMLEKLRLKFQDERKVAEQEEVNTKANYEMLMQKLTDDIKFNKADESKKTAQRAARLEAKATAEGDLDLTRKAKVEDERKLSETVTECSLRSHEFENNQVTRSGEIKAIEQALSVLNSDAVTGNANTYLPTLIQVRATSFAQLRGDDRALRQHIAAFLQGHAKKPGNAYLSLVAEHVQSDPFVKVKKMIKDLIVKLMEQANAEADGKAYCDTELGTNKMTREDKQAEVEALTANIEEKTAESAQLSTEIAQVADEIAAIQQEQAEASRIRAEEKKQNAKTVADAKDAQEAVQRATKVLKDFYASVASGGTALVQDTVALSDAMSQAARAPYSGAQSTSTGIIGMLEVVLSDFARLEAETLHAEDQAQTTYDTFMAETTQDVAVKQTEKAHKEDKRTNTDDLIVNLKKELELTQGELDAAQAYYEKLKPSCVDHGLSYEERVQAREEELQSLKEALAMLQQQDLS